jgi:predicted enzyme related to lactoylglutathione lyase
MPVSDVDRAKRFYQSLGWRLEPDFVVGEFRAVQLTPPRSSCSISFGKGLTTAKPGSVQRLELVVSDIDAGRGDLISRGVEVSQLFHRDDSGLTLSPDPQGRSYCLIQPRKWPDDLVFTNSAGGVLDNTNFRRNIWNPAARSIGLDGFTPHDLRHTTASLAVSAGANVKALQRLLGHGSASMTLDVYSALFDSDLDAVAERLGKPAEDWLRTRTAKVASLDP